jgi:hypothetical protein
MLRILGGRSVNSMRRRILLQAGAIGALNLSLPEYWRSRRMASELESNVGRLGRDPSSCFGCGAAPVISIRST